MKLLLALARLLLSIAIAIASVLTVATVPVLADTYDSTVLSDNPALYWKLDDAQTAQPQYVTDSTSNGNTGIIQGTQGSLQTTGPWTGAKSWTLTVPPTGGTTLSAIAANALGNTVSFSADGWFKFTGGPANETAIFGVGSWQLLLSTSCTFRAVVQGVAVYGVGNQSVSCSDGNWHYIGFSQSGGTFSMVVDAQTTTGNATSKPSENAAFFQFNNSIDAQIRGSESRIAYYKTALSLSRLQAHYTTGTGMGGFNGSGGGGGGGGTGSFIASGIVCMVANAATTQSTPACLTAQAPHYLAGSLVLAKNAGGTIVAQTSTSSTGFYSFTVPAVFGSTVSIEIGLYGPGTPSTNGWAPLGGSYLITIPSVGPLVNHTNLDFEYVTPEARNSTWWTLSGGNFGSGTHVPCLNLAGSCNPGGTGGGGAFGTVAVALLIPEFGVIGLPTVKDKPRDPNAGGVLTGTFSVDLSNPQQTPATVIVSDDQQIPVTGTANTTTISVPAQGTITVPVMGTGGFETTVGEVIVTDTVVQGNPTCNATNSCGGGGGGGGGTGGGTTVGTTTCSLSIFTLWSGLGPLLECLFIPTVTLRSLLGDQAACATFPGPMCDLQAKVGFADFYELGAFICNNIADPTQPCDMNSGLFSNFHGSTWSGYIPWYDPTTGTVSNSIITWTIDTTNPIVQIIQSLVSFGIILFTVGAVGSAILSFFGVSGASVESLTEEQGSNEGEDSEPAVNHEFPD